MFIYMGRQMIMSSQHKVSVIIPVYNRETLVSRAIDSVLQQSYENFEIIAVDDGSKDNSLNVVKELSAKDERVHWIALPTNSGAQAARNAGIRAAYGDWIAFLDSDDEWLPESLQKRLQKAVESGAKVIHSDCLKITEVDTEPKSWGLRPLEGSVYIDLLKKPGPMFQGLLAKKDVLHSIGYLDESIVAYQEWDTFIRLAEHHEFAFVSDPTYIWYFNHGSSISKNKRRNAIGYEQVFKKHKRSILKHAGMPTLMRHYYVVSRLHLTARNYYRAVLCWFLNNPKDPKA